VGFNKQGELVRYKDVDLYIGGGRLVQLGQNIPDTDTMPNVIIQAQGGLVTPAFVDSHTHMFPDGLVEKGFEYMENRFQKELQ
jgi:imidazolonepropionase-like amidohydrolase